MGCRLFLSCYNTGTALLFMQLTTRWRLVPILICVTADKSRIVLAHLEIVCLD